MWKFAHRYSKIEIFTSLCGFSIFLFFFPCNIQITIVSKVFSICLYILNNCYISKWKSRNWTQDWTGNKLNNVWDWWWEHTRTWVLSTLAEVFLTGACTFSDSFKRTPYTVNIRGAQTERAMDDLQIRAWERALVMFYSCCWWVGVCFCCHTVVFDTYDMSCCCPVYVDILVCRNKLGFLPLDFTPHNACETISFCTKFKWLLLFLYP